MSNRHYTACRGTENYERDVDGIGLSGGRPYEKEINDARG